MNIAVVVISNPNDTQQIAGIPCEPSVVRTAGLAGGWRGKSHAAHTGCRSIVHHALHHVGHDGGNTGIENSLFLGRIVFDDFALGVAHGVDQDRGDALTAVGEDRVGGGHIERGRVVGAKRHRWRRSDRSDACGSSQIGDFVVTDLLSQLDGSVIQRHR